METLGCMWHFSIFLLWILCSAVRCCPMECMCSLSNTIVICRNQSLSDIQILFPEDVVAIDLSYNNIQSFPTNLRNYKHLKKINLSHNRLTNIRQNDLLGFFTLEELDLSYNGFQAWKDIHPHAFSMNTKLTDLYLSNNLLRNFPDIGDVHFTSAYLETLDISNCSIDNLHGDIFIDVPNLKKLVLSNNKISALQTQMNATSLETLLLNNCGLQNIVADAFVNMPKLINLSIAKNYGLQLFNATSESLEFLDSSDCALAAPPLNALPNLKKTVMRGNRLSHLADDSFANTPLLQYLDISYNSLSVVRSDAFRGLDNLEILKLHHNIIGHINSDTFNTNFHLKELWLSNNYLSEVPTFDAESLSLLDLSECEISRFDSLSLSKMPYLKYLDLRKNFIAAIPNNLYSESLETLRVRDCKINKITNFTFANLPRLANVDLTGNRLTTHFNASYFYKIQRVSLGDNLWVCDCNSTSFRFFTEFLQQICLDFYDLRCHSPEYLRGKDWNLACFHVWYGDNKSHETWAVSVSVLVGVFVILFLFLCARRYYHIKETRRLQALETQREEARERLRQMRIEQHLCRIEESRNAPDPRELQQPPSYAEALLLPPVNSSTNDLTGSKKSLSGSKTSLGSEDGLEKRKRRRRRRSRTKANLSESDQASISTEQKKIESRNSTRQRSPSLSSEPPEDTNEQSETNSKNNARIFMESDI